MASFLLPSSVWALDNITAIVELDYSSTNERTEDSGRLLSETNTDIFMHRYFLDLDKTIYPNLKIMAGGTFEQVISDSETDNVTSKTTATTKHGHIDLLLSTRLISSGIGYKRTEEDVTDSVPQIRENYNANLSWRPDGLPTLDANFVRTYTFDKERATEDREEDYWSVASTYEPYRNLQLTGQASYNDRTDVLQDLNVKSWNYSLRASYARRFGERVSAQANYNFSGMETKTSAGGTGEVLFQVFPFSGLSALSDTPTLVTLDLNPAVVDGDLLAGAGINLGPPPIGEVVRQRNIGVDFIVPSTVNTIYLWVDRKLPPGVANLFSWDIYISSDNEHWTFSSTVSRAPFGAFDNRFEINISHVSARYLKVVTNPLPRGVVVPPGTDVSNIFVTEMQTFLRRPAEEVGGTTTTQSSHLYDLGVKWRILDRPSLYYDFYYWSLITDPGDVRSLLSNNLNLSHRFNAVFSGAARIGREDIWETDGKSSANVYSASVTAVPLPTLFHSLVVSGRFEDREEGSTITNSAFLNNTAILYKGLNASLAGGVSVADLDTGARTVSTIVNMGVTAIPHPTLSINFNFSQTNAETTGGSEQASLSNGSSFTRFASLSLGYTPFPSLYIYTSFGQSSRTDMDTITLQDYAVTWSPFRDGDLQFNFLYSESLSSENTKNRTITPSLRWNIRRNTTLDVSYSLTSDEALTLKTDARVFAANLRVGFF
jgi:hypothetical protein